MKKELKRSSLVLYCLTTFGQAILSGLVVTYLMTIYIPTGSSNLPILLPNAAIAFALIRGLGTVIDAVIDLAIASKSDRLQHKSGRRTPFMRAAFIPWSICTALLVFAPVQGTSAWNTVWLAITLTGYFVFSSLYMVPYFALSSEIVSKPEKRVFFYTMQTLFFVVGSAVVYVTPILKNAAMAAGVSELGAWRITFAFFGVLGMLATGISAFSIKEKEYVEAKPSYVPMLPSFRATFKYRHYTIFTLGTLFLQVAFSFFNASLMYYITMLLGAPDSFSLVTMSITIAVGIATYPLVNFLSKKWGKKPLLLFACSSYIIIYGAIYLHHIFTPLFGSVPFCILIGVVLGFPISITNIIPQTVYADMAQYDAILTKDNKQAMFSAARSFVVQFGNSSVLMIIPLVISWQSTDSRATVVGVRTTALVALILVAVAVSFYAFYNDNEIQKVIKENVE